MSAALVCVCYRRAAAADLSSAAVALMETSPNTTHLWPSSTAASEWRGVSSSYQVVVQYPAGRNHSSWMLTWAFIDGSCTDGVKNGGETGIDCGGPHCPTSCDRGCTDSRASNYDPEAGIEDYNCSFSGDLVVL